MREPIRLTEDQLTTIQPFRDRIKENYRKIESLKTALKKWIQEDRTITRELWKTLFAMYPELKNVDPENPTLLRMEWNTGEIVSLAKDEAEADVHLFVGREIG